MMLIRRPLSRPRRWLILLALFAALLPHSAEARANQMFTGCRTFQGDYWFVEEVVLEPLVIAPGVLVQPTGRGVKLFNTSARPLYLVETADAVYLNAYAPAAPISLTAPLVVKWKITSGQVAGWNFDHLQQGHVWESAPYTSDFILAELTYSNAWLPGYRSLNRYGDNRPDNVALPSAAHTLRVIYGEELISIPVTVKARLDPDYDPNQERNERERCSRAGTSLAVVFGVAGLVAAVLPLCAAVIIFFGLYGLVRVIRRNH